MMLRSLARVVKAAYGGRVHPTARLNIRHLSPSAAAHESPGSQQASWRNLGRGCRAQDLSVCILATKHDSNDTVGSVETSERRGKFMSAVLWTSPNCQRRLTAQDAQP